MAQFCCIRKYQGMILITYLVRVLYLLDTQRKNKNFMSQKIIV